MSQPASSFDRYDPSGLPEPTLGAGPPPSNPSGSRRAQWLIVLAVAALVLVPAMWGAAPGEIARWYDAAALEKRLSGDLPGAIKRLDTALTWNEKSAARYVQRAEYRRENRDYEGSLEDLNAALKFRPDDLEVVLDRVETLQLLRRHPEAIADFKTIAKEVAEGRVNTEKINQLTTLNGLAYAQGVGNVELDEGLAAADLVVKLLGGDPYVREQLGYYHLARKDRAAAQGRLLEAAKLIEADLALLKLEAGQASDKSAQERYRTRIVTLETRLASVQFQLSRAYREQGDAPSADRYEKLSLAGGHPEAKLRDRLPSLEMARRRATMFAGVIDTRGYLHYRLGNGAPARRDLELALELAEMDYQHQLDNFGDDRPGIVDLRKYQLFKLEQRKKNVAVILYHRGLMYEKLGLAALAQRDFRRVEQEFGFTPGDELF